MNRVWLLTWTTYGTWLPGDDRGFVSNVRDGDGLEVKHNTPGTPYDARQRGLAIAARDQMAGEPVWLTSEQATILAEQFRETASYRGWSLLALAIMANHVHLVVGVPGDPEPDTLLRDIKSYGSRRLNQRFGKPPSAKWWTASGSRRKLPDRRAVHAAVRYVQNQQRPLVVWVSENPPADAGGSPEVTV
jgi:REP element-mobilizing transposase RayT